MKWSRAIHHLEELAQTCADMASRPATIFPLRVTQLWAYGDVLTSGDSTIRDDVSSNRADLDWLQVALTVDLPADEVAWFCPPVGAEHWAQATRLSKNPVVAMWRSTQAPVWNHHIHRPLLIWDESATVPVDSLSALRDGTAEALRLPEPTSAELQARLDAELAASHRALESATARYEQRRFSPGKLTPVADALWRTAQGYLDVQAATHQLPPQT
jgi:hypothetical protein